MMAISRMKDSRYLPRYLMTKSGFLLSQTSTLQCCDYDCDCNCEVHETPRLWEN
jgi:hypothetical protein